MADSSYKVNERDWKATERDWPEDFKHENGNYWNECCSCHGVFAGHKRRVVCKICSMKTRSIEVNRRYPVYSVPWENALRGLRVFQDRGIKVEPIWQLNLWCLVRAWYGSYWRAAFELVKHACENVWLNFKVGCVIRWCRWRGLSDDQVEKIILGEKKKV